MSENTVLTAMTVSLPRMLLPSVLDIEKGLEPWFSLGLGADVPVGYIVTKRICKCLSFHFFYCYLVGSSRLLWPLVSFLSLFFISSSKSHIDFFLLFTFIFHG